MNNVSAFTTFVLRTPLLPVNFYTSLLDNYSSEKLFTTLENPYVKNAIALASPELYSELEKYRANPISFSKDKISSLEQSLLKYIARISARATPFGLFAGCTTGTFDTQTNIELQSKEKYTSHTQFDMQFWTHLLQELGKEDEVRATLDYYPNSSMYKIGDFYRYVEYKFVNKRREHTISAIRKNNFIATIYEAVTSGKKRMELVHLIIDDVSETEEALAFINELIDNQFLVSNLEATVTGGDEMGRVLAVLEKVEAKTGKCDLIKEAKVLLVSMENNIIRHQRSSQSIQEKVKQWGIDFEEKYLLQTDLYTKTYTCTLSNKTISKLKQVITFLDKIQDSVANSNLEAFKKAFLNRYESKEMPLSVVLDSEVGIGYLQNSSMNDSHSLLDKLPIFKNSKSATIEERWSKVDYLLEKKVKECSESNQNILVLKDEDFKEFTAKNRHFPATFSAMIEVIQEEDKETIIMESLGSISAARLIGRFCNGEEAIHDFAKEIVAKEAHLYPHAILAEVAHIPESRTGNILRRPVLRTYEITYLSNSVLPKEKQIDIEDLTISIRNNTIVLKSKRLNKIIIPCLSNAHNYSNNALPIYQFLCDLQGQNVSSVYSFNWGVLPYHYNDFPRVVYKEVILAKAKWYVYQDELKTVDFTTNFSHWKTKKKLPRYVNIVSGDNTLLLDLEQEICFDMIQKTAKSNGKVILEEFLFTNDSVVKDKEGNPFANQFVVSFFKEAGS